MNNLRILLILFFAILSNALYASHIVGGSIYWECLNNGKYVFYLEVNRDCTGIPYSFRNDSIEIRSSKLPKGENDSTLTAISIIPDSNRWIENNWGDISDHCDESNFSSPQISCKNRDDGSIQVFYYKSAPITLKGVPPADGWSFIFTAPCCRPGDIANLASPSGQMVLLSNMYANFAKQNANPCYDSSPKFEAPPIISLCRGVPKMHFNLAAIDQENDSLSFGWAKSYRKSYVNGANGVLVPLAYKPQYSDSVPTPDTSFDQRNVPMVLNPKTGLFELAVFSGGGTQRFTYVAQVDAYKEKVKIASVRREVVVAVRDCDTLSNGQQNTAPEFYLNGLKQNNIILNVNAGDSVRVPVKVIDKDGQNQRLTLTAHGNELTADLRKENVCRKNCAYFKNALFQRDTLPYGVNYSLKGNDSVSTELVWKTNCAILKKNGRSKAFTFYLNVSDNHCSLPTRNSATITINVLPPRTATLPVLECLQQYNGINQLNWSSVSPVDSFKAWVVYGALVDTLSPFIPIDTLNKYTTNTYTDTLGVNGKSKYLAYYVQQVFTLCGVENVLNSRSVNTGPLELKLSATKDEFTLNWQSKSINSNNTYYIHQSLDSAQFEIVDSVFNRQEYVLKDTLCYSNLRFYVSAKACAQRTNSVLIDELRDSIGISKMGVNRIVADFTLRNSTLNGKSMISVEESYDSINFVSIDSVDYATFTRYIIESADCNQDSWYRFRFKGSCGVISSNVLKYPKHPTQIVFNNELSRVFSNNRIFFRSLQPRILASDNYYWVNCKDYRHVVYSRNNLYFGPRDTGDYALIYKTYKCSDTSYCMSYPQQLNDSIAFINDSTLMSFDIDAEYQWYNCSIDSIVSGANNQTFVPKDTGYYAVILKEDTLLLDTSNCLPYFPSPLNDSIAFINDSTLMSFETDAKYQWYNCSKDSIVVGANNQTFVPTDTGFYAVILKKDPLFLDTSNCLPYFPTSLIEVDFSESFSVYPNPTSNFVTIEFSEAQSELNIQVRSIHSQIVQKEFYTTAQEIQFELNQPAGIYFLRLLNQQGEQAVFKVIKQ